MTGDETGRGEDGVVLHILHTNDFHNALREEGIERLRAAIADLHGAPYLLLDAGDAIKAGNVGVNPFGEPILDRMSELGYHAMTMGNREFHVAAGAFAMKVAHAKFPVLCANVRPQREGTHLPVQPLARLEVGGLRVVVFGITVPMVTAKMKVAPLSAYLFDDPIETAQKIVTAERWGADVLIALTHIGLREDERLACAVSGIDLIIGGHSHVSLSEPKHVDGTPIVQAGWHAHSFGHVILSVSQTGVKVKSAELLTLQEMRTR